MKTKLKKYLSGSREGFSLVELIIVIAIMAILIGVVALAVIPYLAKSRESKDLSTLDTVCSALSSAVASTQVTGKGSFVYTGAETTGTAETDKVNNAMVEVMGSGSTTLTSTDSDGNKVEDIVCYFDSTNNVIYAYGAESGSTAVATLKSTVTGYKGVDENGKPETDTNGKALIVSN
jgi:type IV pilus assembly protein PilA